MLVASFALFIAQDAVGSAESRERPQRDARPLSYDYRLMKQGRLKNGMRYAILPRNGRESGVGLLMRVEGGFIDERRPGERGLAHLIEHIAIEGDFRRILVPLTFPAPTAGTTSWGETTYFLSSRRSDLADLDVLLSQFRRVSSDLTFPVEEVDQQRAEVIREMDSKRLGNAIYASYIAAVAPGSPNDLIDAQNSDDVPTASIETIRALYRRIYRPTRTTMVVVGNLDPEKIEALIHKHFGSWNATGPSLNPRRAPTFHPKRVAAVSYSDFAEGRTVATISATLKSPQRRQTQAKRMQLALVSMTTIEAINERFAREGTNVPEGKTGVSYESSDDGFHLIRFWDFVLPNQWPTGVVALKRMACDLLDQGLAEPEWTSAKGRVIRALESRVTDMTDTKNVALAAEIGRSIAFGEHPISPNELLNYARIWLPTVEVARGNDWWKTQWRGGVEHARVESPELKGLKHPLATIRSVIGMTAERAKMCKSADR